MEKNPARHPVWASVPHFWVLPVQELVFGLALFLNVFLPCVPVFRGVHVCGVYAYVHAAGTVEDFRRALGDTSLPASSL